MVLAMRQASLFYATDIKHGNNRNYRLKHTTRREVCSSNHRIRGEGLGVESLSAELVLRSYVRTRSEQSPIYLPAKQYRSFGQPARVKRACEQAVSLASQPKREIHQTCVASSHLLHPYFQSSQSCTHAQYPDSQLDQDSRPSATDAWSDNGSSTHVAFIAYAPLHHRSVRLNPFHRLSDTRLQQ